MVNRSRALRRLRRWDRYLDRSVKLGALPAYQGRVRAWVRALRTVRRSDALRTDQAL